MNQAGGSSSLSLRSLSNLFLIESLFSLAGGFMDAYAYLAHGHVFANAQTGNVVLLAVSSAGRDWSQAGRHIPPILACALGVMTAKFLGVKSKKQSLRATLVCQILELLAIVALTLFDSSLPNFVVVPTLSFVVALQVTSFNKLGPWGFNSAMTTGNLRSATEGIVLWWMGEDRHENAGKATVAAVACLCFLSGAFFGAFFTHRFPRYALVPCVVLLLAGHLLTWHEHTTNSKRF